MPTLQDALKAINAHAIAKRGPDPVKVELLGPDAKKNDEDSYFFVKDGQPHPEKRHRGGKITSPVSREGGVMTATIGPNITEIPLTMGQSKHVLENQLQLMDMTVRRERAAMFQYYASGVLSMVMACIMAAGVYQGLKNPTHYNP